jgi:hypothetical protein
MGCRSILRRCKDRAYAITLARDHRIHGSTHVPDLGSAFGIRTHLRATVPLQLTETEISSSK